MIENVKGTSLLIKEFSINKLFTGLDGVVFTLDLHFYGDVYLKNWGRFFSYYDAFEFACNMIATNPNDPVTQEYLPMQPEGRIEVED